MWLSNDSVEIFYFLQLGQPWSSG